MAVEDASGVSLEDIAKQTDVARTTIYNHFENKGALIREMIVQIYIHAKDYLKSTSELGVLSLDYLCCYGKVKRYMLFYFIESLLMM